MADTAPAAAVESGEGGFAKALLMIALLPLSRFPGSDVFKSFKELPWAVKSPAFGTEDMSRRCDGTSPLDTLTKTGWPRWRADFGHPAAIPVPWTFMSETLAAHHHIAERLSRHNNVRFGKF